MKSTIENIRGKLSSSEVSTIEESIREEEDWMESNEEADKEDYDAHLK